MADQASGVWADTSLIKPVDFHGKFFDVSGALTLPRSPQGRPAFAQAGSSGPGIELAGGTADLVFTAQPDIPSGQRFRSTVRDAAARHGRAPDSVLVLPGGLEFTGTPEQFAGPVPLLRKRGLHRTEYTATTLRGHIAEGRAADGQDPRGRTSPAS